MLQEALLVVRMHQIRHHVGTHVRNFFGAVSPLRCLFRKENTIFIQLKNVQESGHHLENVIEKVLALAQLPWP